jgi:hypothetical protein
VTPPDERTESNSIALFVAAVMSGDPEERLVVIERGAGA